MTEPATDLFPRLTRTNSQRLRAMYRLTGWLYQILLKLEQQFVGNLDRSSPAFGRERHGVAVLLAIVAGMFVPTVTTAETARCHVFGVSDGDTIRVRCGEGEQLRVRLAEIDAPEKAQAFGKAAKDQLSDLVYGRDVSLDVVDTDRYGRTVALVETDGMNVNKEMLQRGMAWCYSSYAKHDWCAQSQLSARAAKIGLWSGSEPTPPWEYRRRRKR